MSRDVKAVCVVGVALGLACALPHATLCDFLLAAAGIYFLVLVFRPPKR